MSPTRFRCATPLSSVYGIRLASTHPDYASTGDTAQHGSQNDWGEIRTLASEDTGALNQRLRPLGHPTINLTGRIRTIDLGIAAC